MAEIAFVLPSFAGGGAERVAITLADRLRPRGFGARIIVLSADGPLAAAVPPDLPVENLDRPRLRSAAWPLLRRLNAAPPDVVVSTLPHVNLLLGAARPLLPRATALVLRQSNMLARDGAAPSLRQRLAHSLAYRNADAVVAVTAAMRAELAALSPRLAALTTVVPNPIDTKRLRAEIGAAPGPRRAAVELVASGRLVAHKNVAGLLSALAGTAADWHLAVLGDGPERHALEAQAASLGIADRVTFVGFTERAAAYVGTADALVMASRREGMPNAALEALACGTPVIGPATIPALEELAAQSPEGARLYRSPEDLRRLVEGLVPLAGNRQRPSLLPAAYELDAAVATFAAVIERVLSGRRAAYQAAPNTTPRTR